MAITQIEPYYDVGTATFAASTAVTGQGTSWLTNVMPGDQIFNRLGQMAVVQSVNSDTSITLTKAFAGTVQTAQAYTIYRVPDSVRLENFSQRSVNLLKGGNVRALADLSLGANNLIKATGAGALETFDGANVISLAGLTIGSGDFIVGTGGGTVGTLAGGNIQAEASLTGAADTLSYYTGPAAKALTPFTSAARDLLNASNAPDQRVIIGLAGAALQALKGVVPFADTFPYFTGAGTADRSPITTIARDLLNASTNEDQLTNLGFTTGTNAQGTWVRIPLGRIQICFHREFKQVAVTSGPLGGMYYSGVQSWSAPAAFAAGTTPYFAGTARTTGHLSDVVSENIGPSVGRDYFVRNSVSLTADFDLRFLAIGVY